MISSNITGTAVYNAVQGGLNSRVPAPAAADTDTAAPSFGGALQAAIGNLGDLGRTADAQSVQALSGRGNLTDVVMAVSKAEMALQASVAVRDRVISAYQDIMR